jgi:hypothetical protein
MAKGTTLLRSNPDSASNTGKRNGFFSVVKWLLPRDFNISGAETALEDKLQKYESHRWNEKIHHRASRADGYGDLWSCVNTPI